MSDNILPFEIQVEIIKKVPDVKSLVRFRAVSKPWKSFIDSPDFIAGYGARDTNSLLLRYKDSNSNEDVKYVCFVDDDNNNNNVTTLTQQQQLLDFFAPKKVPQHWFLSRFFSWFGVPDWMKKQFNDLEVIGSSHGLLCFRIRNTGMFLLSNPCIRKSVSIQLPNYPFRDGFLGFAVCPVTNDPTIVWITQSWLVGIFTLSSKRFSFFQYTKLPRKMVQVMSSPVVIDTCIYWAAYEATSSTNGGFFGSFHYRYMIMSFDLIDKEIRLVDIPRSCILNNSFPQRRFFISELRGSLVLFVPNEAVEIPVCGVWKMEHDESFTNLFTITTPGYTLNNILGFRKNGELVMETQKEEDQQFAALEVYEPSSECISNLGIFGEKRSFFMASYKETLLLLNELDFVYVQATSNAHRDDGLMRETVNAWYLGIQQVVFGGRSVGDWEEGMKNPEDGYKSFKI